MHTNLILLFKHSSTSVIKAVQRAEILPVILRIIGQSTFKTEALHLVSNVQLVKRLFCEMKSKYVQYYLDLLWK